MKTRPRRITALVLGFVAGLVTSFALTEPHAAEAAQLGGCPGSCGPAPCCEILWTTFCGCPWGEEAEVP